jgi:hypothetical protein
MYTILPDTSNQPDGGEHNGLGQLQDPDSGGNKGQREQQCFVPPTHLVPRSSWFILGRLNMSTSAINISKKGGRESAPKEIRVVFNDQEYKFFTEIFRITGGFVGAFPLQRHG